MLDEQPIQKWLTLPDTLNWSQINTGYIQGKSLVLIGKDKVLLAERKGKAFQYERETVPQHYFANWPYSWGTGNVSAARLLPSENKVVFYRNMESAVYTIDQKTIEKVVPLKLKWIGEIK